MMEVAERVERRAQRAPAINCRVRRFRGLDFDSEVLGFVKERYQWRGYSTDGATLVSQFGTTFGVERISRQGAELLGTVTVRVGMPTVPGGPQGLACEHTFEDLIKPYRSLKERHGEACLLAIKAKGAEQLRVLAVLFHVAYVYMQQRGVTRGFFEVHPKHAAYYRNAVGFVDAGVDEAGLPIVRQCGRAKAPAVLLTVTCSHVVAEVARYGGHRMDSDAPRHSLYPLCFGRDAHEELTRRLAGMERSRDDVVYGDVPQAA